MTDAQLKERFLMIINQNWGSFSKDFVDKSSVNFDKTILDGEAKGIVWSDISFDRIETSLSSDMAGVTDIKLKYYFKYNKTSYYVTFKTVNTVKAKAFISLFKSGYVNSIN